MAGLLANLSELLVNQMPIIEQRCGITLVNLAGSRNDEIQQVGTGRSSSPPPRHPNLPKETVNNIPHISPLIPLISPSPPSHLPPPPPLSSPPHLPPPLISPPSPPLISPPSHLPPLPHPQDCARALANLTSNEELQTTLYKQGALPAVVSFPLRL